jgi:DnaJ-like protein
MLLCTDCLHADDRQVEHCPSCGGSAFAKVTKNGDLVSVPAQAGMPCQHCLETDRDLKLRYYRRVAGMVFMDRIWAEAGYFCARCRRQRFARNMAFTVVLGWWGLFAMLFRNPYAIFVNAWAVFAPPLGAGQLGAMNVNDIRASAAQQEASEQRLADVYMRMPGWMETLTEDDVSRILANVDYYSALNVSSSASHGEIKAAWREQVKVHHPDLAGVDRHERIVAINDAWAVLGDERLRHAYDHREELLSFLQDAGAVASEFTQDQDDNIAMVVGCRECRLGFESFDAAADHVDALHPNTDYDDILVSLVEGGPDAGPTEPNAADAPRWRCKACSEAFADYGAALDHADRAHPDRVTVDPRTAVEAM